MYGAWVGVHIGIIQQSGSLGSCTEGHSSKLMGYDGHLLDENITI